MFDEAGRSLRDALLARFKEPVSTPMPAAAFDALALRIFAYQYERNRPYAAYCRRRGKTPDTVTNWSDIPAVPTAAFREVELIAGVTSAAHAVFRTSGTTRSRRGRHFIPDLALYHGALLPNFREHVVPDLADPLMLSLIPAPGALPDSSLSHMVAVVMDRLGARDSAYFATVDAGLDFDALDAVLRTCEATDRPVVLLGTSFALVHWTDSIRARHVRYELPALSRIMDTGGYKGRSREVDEEEMRATYAGLLGIDGVWCVNEYGMTELSSQFYDATLREHVMNGARSERRKTPPAWVRTLVVNPDTLEPLPAGEVGLLRHIDLANLGSVVAVQTEDLGREFAGGFRVLGRAAGAQPRGCSIAMDELLLATHGET